MDIDEEFIVKEETGGRPYYEQTLKSTFDWPGGASGCTAMVGIDVGYYTAQEVADIFEDITKPAELRLIQGGRTLKGREAENYVGKLKKIIFPWETAIEVFGTHTLPKFSALAVRAFPGLEALCPGAQTAIVSIVFNRGTAMKGDTRREMAALRQLVPKKDYKAMAAQILSMRRLWPKGNGLIGRREREAKLVQSCA